MNYNEIVDRFKEIVQDHKMLQDFGYGQISDIKTRSEGGAEEQGTDYPYLFLNPGTHQRDQQTITYNFNMIIMDMARGEEEDDYQNFLNIQSDCIQYCDDVIARLYYYYKDQPEISFNITYTPFYERFQDQLAGATAVISIEVPNAINECIAPFQPDPFIVYSWDPTQVAEPDPAGTALDTLQPTEYGAQYWFNGTDAAHPFKGIYLNTNEAINVKVNGSVNQVEDKPIGLTPKIEINVIKPDNTVITPETYDAVVSNWPATDTVNTFQWNAEWELYNLPTLDAGDRLIFTWNYSGLGPEDESTIQFLESTIEISNRL